jgi:adenylosuccinate synthase
VSPVADLALLESDKVNVQYKTLPGWQEDITKCRSYSELPQKCKDYVEFIEQFLGVPIEWIGVGPGRDAMIHKK